MECFVPMIPLPMIAQLSAMKILERFFAQHMSQCWDANQEQCVNLVPRTLKVSSAQHILYAKRNVNPTKCFVLMELIPEVARMLTYAYPEEEIMMEIYALSCAHQNVPKENTFAQGCMKVTAAKDPHFVLNEN